MGTIVAGKAGTAGVVTERGVLWLEEVQLAGKRATPIGAFLQARAGLWGAGCLPDLHKRTQTTRMTQR